MVVTVFTLSSIGHMTAAEASETSRFSTYGPRAAPRGFLRWSF